MNSSKTIRSIYTDGACSGNPGPGGWATVVYFTDDSVHEIGGADVRTTNNRMELQGAIGALKYVLDAKQTAPVSVYTDSEYVKNGITKWLNGWKKKGWKTSAGKPVLNQELWETLDRLRSQVEAQLNAPIQWKYVKGHSGDRGNDRCDEIARAFSLGKIPVLTTIAANSTEATDAEEIQSSESIGVPASEPAMVDSTNPLTADGSELPREVRVTQLRYMVETLHMADEVASRGYLITSSELADLMDVNASAVTSRGDNWVWRNWVVSRVRREGNQILWQLERID
ncbi:ribonuclease HI [Oculatella sp. LEGE 06141]|uniref:ribonuclease HI n=1 Tax=Oculatella sp. LEGE 06141 TaxID=1828648 RepID=UPI00187E9B9D|nr:ribonuclease HI [Oculatella sp. LEGE 06141]MBE9181676.1 ribonuclease HI [Oculatella sp. LEGE 06141]